MHGQHYLPPLLKKQSIEKRIQETFKEAQETLKQSKK
jgi:hypothetical protein